MNATLKSATLSSVFQGSLPSGERFADTETYFFQSFLRLRNGSYKLTYPKRLADLDAMTVRHLGALRRPLELMDVGVSSGVTTVEWSDALASAGIEHRMVAGDLIPRARLYSLGRWFHVLADDDKHPMQMECWGAPFKTSINPSDFLRLDGILVPLLRMFSAVVVRFEGLLPVRHHDVWLVTRRLLEDSRFDVVKDNVFVEAPPFKGRFDAIRAANLLNRSYFDEAALARAIRLLALRLRPGGLLIVCRTLLDETNAGTIFRLRPDAREFEIVERLGEGSEVEGVVSRLSSFAAV